MLIFTDQMSFQFQWKNFHLQGFKSIVLLSKMSYACFDITIEYWNHLYQKRHCHISSKNQKLRPDGIFSYIGCICIKMNILATKKVKRCNLIWFLSSFAVEAAVKNHSKFTLSFTPKSLDQNTWNDCEWLKYGKNVREVEKLKKMLQFPQFLSSFLLLLELTLKNIRHMGFSCISKKNAYVKKNMDTFTYHRR